MTPSPTHPPTETYNHRHASVKDNRPTLELSTYADVTEEFKTRHIMKHIATLDAEQHVFYKWMRLLNNANFRFSEWSNIKSNQPFYGVCV